ncbi:unnamed protein product [Chondrus crispus]|uniref:Uncharacterized protein n=1 Tax=Chondrus crispus TaxID=2769 RepID=R7QV37_CHOCR|nr:unnamed protein product [Chondrus crispus]CDF41225.1 unnamed protein product [Chondrus crispus]|eukprot:XP_005711519.1 unnamed protein product [Chondrus crispus]
MKRYLLPLGSMHPRSATLQLLVFHPQRPPPPSGLAGPGGGRRVCPRTRPLRVATPGVPHLPNKAPDARGGCRSARPVPRVSAAESTAAPGNKT